MSPLISAGELIAELGAPGLVLVDCRHDLADPTAGRRAYAGGHLPGAVPLHLDEDLSGAKTGRNGRHPLPDPLALARSLSNAGIGDGSRVVAYDGQGGMYAARLWWLLRWLGFDAVQVLDGGVAAFVAAGGTLDTAVTQPVPAVFTPKPRPGWTVDAATVLDNLDRQDFTVIDARAPGRYAGEGETLDPVAGHIPGALNRFFQLNLQPDGRFKPAEQLRAEWQALLAGLDPHDTVQQCGSGVTACHNLLALEAAGLKGSRLYPGSWSEWCSDPARPVAVGTN
ncbi:sulfurtransferase [Chitinimonas koreensis]|uniref:sulfurtransferase n=1 Tax=Chitinimonas koreensis TaxID=356302 RepID=UPI000416C9F8|nr:sulfurtransferase [Chitinimonas koreensis]QNM95892.1 sulfurtransferase [Chitinimonas koreensis]